MRCLEVHHKQFRSQSGDDSESDEVFFFHCDGGAASFEAKGQARWHQ
jgi:hypothetical protein